MRRLGLMIIALFTAASAQPNSAFGKIIKTVGTATSHSVSLALGHTPSCTPNGGVIDGSIVSPELEFEGQRRLLGSGCDGFPMSDDAGAVGPNKYVQVVNDAITIFDLSGTLLTGPVGTSTFWKTQPTCGKGFATDSVVIYDRANDRWVMSRPGDPKGYLCLAISQTPDPTGQWDQYAFQIGNATNGLTGDFIDYAKIAAWPGSYLATADPNKIFSGLGNTISAFDQSAMLAGDPKPHFVTWFVPTPSHSPGTLVHSHMLPANLDGATPPPAASPAYVVQVQDEHLGFKANRLQIYEVNVDWSTPAAASLTLPPSLAPSFFNSLVCPWPQANGSCIAEPSVGGGINLDSMSYGYMMFRLTYRNFGKHESLLFNHTVAADGNPSHRHAGIRWYELRQTGGGGWTIYQQQTYAPDSDNRWLGSIAMDRLGNILLAYDVSGPTTYPSIRYAGRLVKDPLGTLPRGEGTIMAGTGAQTNGDKNSPHFGDYSAMTVDPDDDCTFWDTNTYYPATTTQNLWHTRVAAIRFPGCH